MGWCERRQFSTGEKEGGTPAASALLGEMISQASQSHALEQNTEGLVSLCESAMAGARTQDRAWSI